MGVTENPRDVFASCAIVWTRDKRCFQRQWQLTQPRTKNEHDARWARGLAHGLEPAVTLRTSGLIGFEADSAEDVVRLQAALGEADVTAWVVEYRDTPEGRRLHVYVRQPLPALELPKVSYRFEGGQLIAAANNYYRCAYDDGPYQLLSVNEDAPPMTAEAYDYFQRLAATAERRKRADLRAGEPLAEGSRRNTVFRFACFLSRWTDDEELAADLADVYQQAYCDPPIPYQWVAQQVRGAWRVAESEERLACDLLSPRIAFQPLRSARTRPAPAGAAPRPLGCACSTANRPRRRRGSTAVWRLPWMNSVHSRIA
jgi:hypothetical protein